MWIDNDSLFFLCIEVPWTMKRCVPVIYSWRIAILNAPFDIQKNMINWRANLNAKFWKKIDIVNLSCAFY